MNTSNTTDMIDYDAIRERMSRGDGPAYWQSLEQLADTPEFQAKMKAEFPSQESKWVDPLARRTFLKVMGASMAFSGLTACNVRKPRETILPYAKQPEQMVLGKPLFFATAAPHNGYGYPVLVETHEGRPTKIEGNPEHPNSLGAALSWTQASVLGMYDPDRSQAVSNLGELRDWTDFLRQLGERLAEQQSTQGAGFRVLTETVTSPTMGAQLQALLEKYPQAKWVQYDPAGRDNAREGGRLAFGEYVETHYNIADADVIVSLDSDFMVEGPAALTYSRQFADRRRVRAASDKINRYYAIETTTTCSGSLSDHRLALKPSQVEGFARALAGAAGVAGAGAAVGLEAHQSLIAAIAADLKAAAGRGVVVAGDDCPATVHALAHAINSAIGAVGVTVSYTEPIEVRPSNQLADLKQLVSDMNAGNVHILLILGGNPVYNAPGDLAFESAIRRVSFCAHHSEYEDETSELCHWQIPAPHYLETWSDIRSANGMVTIAQPMIAPLYTSRSYVELLQAVVAEAGRSAYEIIQDSWKKQRGEAGFDKFWRRSLHDGFVVDSSAKLKQVTAKTEASAFPASAPVSGLEIAIRPDPSITDGRYANNAWLQELPKPFTKLTWDNTVLMSLSTAHGLGVKNEDVVRLTVGNRTVEGPVYIMMGHAPESVTVHLGYGRTRSGRVAMTEDDTFFTPRGSRVGIVSSIGSKSRGFNAYTLWGSDLPRVGIPVSIEKAGDKTYPLSSTQIHFSLDDHDVRPDRDIPVIGKAFMGPPGGENTQLKNRGLVRRGTIQDYSKFEAEAANDHSHENHDHEHDEHGHHDDHTSASYAAHLGGPHVPPEQVDFYEGAWDYKKGYQWGMSIDTGVCHGCNACVVACQAENNIPVVGKEEVRRQHEMHWLRIDTYYTGSLDTPTVTHQPMLCQQCENAPCEVVCPVAATAHSEEGLNDMVYNRCVGTRFCSNNCPYKVRRYNWFFYSEQAYKSPLAKMLNNPDVTVRSRGVMEKCSYCVQRINSARIEAENESRAIRDGEILTACQATCPTDAIVFGNINDRHSRVSELKALPLNYGLLVDLNTKPRTSYLAAINNPNPEIKKV